ncbi:glycoside hydrolase family 76 protein [Neomicrococcus lactis]
MALFQYDDAARQALSQSLSWRAASARATLAARSVTTVFGHRLFGWVPGTHLGMPYVPPNTAPVNQTGLWHYWWQAHYVDCLVDAGWREYITRQHVTGASLPSAGKLGARTIMTVGMRNGFKFTNEYFDDMAWMALASQRSAELAAQAKKNEKRERRVARYLRPVLHSAQTDDLGGGLFWHKVRDFKNTAATGPAALYFARTGEPERAAPLLDWLMAHLKSPETGLLMDGLRIVNGKTELVPHIFSYNQGPVLGIMLQLGRAQDLENAAELVHNIARHLTLEDGVTLKTHGHGDGGLFTGILCRYLGLVARDQRIDESARVTAEALIRATARNLWERRHETMWKKHHVMIFPGETSLDVTPVGEHPWELAQQLQAWMIFEAQARLELA